MDALSQPGAAAQDEVLFLIVGALSQGPFAQLGEALARGAAEKGLLPRRHDVHGAQHPLSFEQLQQRYAHLPPNALQQLLSQLLERRRQEAPQPAARGLTSLLEVGTLSVLSGGAAAAPGPVNGPPAWLRPGRHLLSVPHRLLLRRQCGLLPSAQHPQSVQPAEDYARQLQHQLTVRGHRFAVYCITYDRTGRYIITGSDDRLVKVWSTQTGLLLASCRGHDAEITDLAVSADNTMVASSSMDATLRVWQLEGEGRPGLPVSVLVGHEAPAAFVDFHPTIPDALLSASFDGTLRIWRARDPGAPPIVLHIDPARFGLTGHAVTRLGGLGWSSFAGPAGTGLLEATGIRTTRNMERQLLGLGLGNPAAGAAASTAGAAAAAAGEQGVRQSGRNARQHRSLAELHGGGLAGEQGDDADGGAGAGGEGSQDGAAQGSGLTGLLVCGFSREGTHIVAGGNDCNVYIWHWPVAQPAAQAQTQAQARQRGGAGSSTPGGRAAQGAQAAAATLAPAPPPVPAGRPPPPPGVASPPAAMAGSPSAGAASTPVAPAGSPPAGSPPAGSPPAGSPPAGAASPPAPQVGAMATADDQAGPQATDSPPAPAGDMKQAEQAPLLQATEQQNQQEQEQEQGQQQEQQQGQQQQQEQQQEQQRSQEQQQAAPLPAPQQAAAAAVVKEEAEEVPWPAPRELCQLKGHRNDVILLQFSHEGDRVATGSKDGSVRVWRQPRRWRKRPQAWEQEVTFAVLPDPEAIKEARRRRRPPPAPSIDQISWSADDQRLVVSVTDFGIRVLAMPSGQLLHHLQLHTSHIHILECHPTDPCLAFSASYDGSLVLWNTQTGTVLRKFSSRQTRPDGRSWPDLIPFADGHFSSDGSTITVTDVAGQLHHYALGAPCPLLRRAPYDQFFTTDYNQLIRDLQHNVVDAETQEPPHLVTGLLCDTLGHPYPEPLQQAFRAQRVLSAPLEDVAWVRPGQQPSYLSAAPTLTAAAWEVEQANGTEHAVNMAIARAQERLIVHEDRLDAGASAAVAQEAAAVAGRPRSRQRGAAAAVAGAWGDEVVVADEGAEPASSGEMYGEESMGADSDEDVDSMLLTSEEDDEDEVEAGGRSRDAGRGQRGGRRRRRGGAAAAEASRHSSRLAGRQAAARAAARGGSGAAGPSTRRSRAATEEAAAQQQQQQRSDEDHEAREERQRLDRQARAERRQAAHQARLAQERQRRQRQAAARRRQWHAGDSSEEEEEQQLSEAGSGGEEDMDGAGSSRRPAAAAAAVQRSRRRGRAEMEGEEQEQGQEEEGLDFEGLQQAAAAREEGRQRKRQRRAGGRGGGRALFNYAWLVGSEQTPGVYVPQAGDSVVYLREGHEQFLTSTNDKRPPPWVTLRHGRSIRPAEPCRVVDVQYVIANDGTDHTIAQLTLSLCDDASPLKDTCFAVEVPPPVAGHAEFVIHRSRFEASVIAKCWEVGQQCQVYWNDDEATGNGKWWIGTIQQDSRDGRNADVLADPFGSGQLWNRYEVEWQGVMRPDGVLVDEQADNSLHCPWELYVPGTTNQAAVDESPTLDPAVSERMLMAVEAASCQDRFSIFQEAPHHTEQYYSTLSRRNEHYNRLVALPLSLHEIASRLRSGYYRQPEALACDVATVASNAVAFNGPDSEIAEDAAALAAYLTAVLAGQEVDLATYATFPEDQQAEAAAAAGAAAGPAGGTRAAPQQQQQQQQSQSEGRPVMEGEAEQVQQEAAPGAVQQQQQQQQQQHAWPSMQLQGASTSPPTAAGAGRAGGGGGGQLRVRFTLNSSLRAAAAAAAGGDGQDSSGGEAMAEAAAAADPDVVAAAAAAAAAGPPADWFAALPAAGPASTATANGDAAADAGAVPLAAAPPAAWFAASAPAAAALAADGVSLPAPPADWFASMPAAAAQANGSELAAVSAAEAVKRRRQQQQVAGAAGGRYGLRDGTGSRQRRSYASYGYGSDGEEEGEAGGSSSEDGGGGRQRPRRAAAAVQQQQQQQQGRRSSGRAVQRRSYRESDGEEDAGFEENGGGTAAGFDASWAHAFEAQQQQVQPAPARRQRKPPRPRQQQDAHWTAADDWQEDAEEEEEDEQEVADKEDSYRPDASSGEDSDEAGPGGSDSDSYAGGRQKQRSTRRAGRRS